jgi:hypothetical protein
MRAFLKTKSGQLAFFAFVTITGVYSIYGFVGTVHETHIRFIDQDLRAAWTESQKLPLGFARGEDYLRRLKSIKTAYAPSDFKQALSDYIGAYERSLIMMEAGRDPSAETKPMSEARARMIAIEREYR